jgi:hypothetical protein
MAGKYSLDLLDVQRGGSWFRGWVSDVALRQPVSLARRILKNQGKSEKYANLLHRLFWGTVREVRIKGENQREAAQAMFAEYGKEKVLAALILGATANKRADLAHIAYQALSEEREKLRMELVEKLLEQNKRLSNALPHVKAHALKKDRERRTRIANEAQWGPIKTLCEKATKDAGALWCAGDTRDHAAMTRYLIDQHESDGAHPYSELSTTSNMLRKHLKELAEATYPDRVRGKRRNT